jgi:hypothetical protein
MIHRSLACVHIVPSSIFIPLRFLLIRFVVPLYFSLHLPYLCIGTVPIVYEYSRARPALPTSCVCSEVSLHSESQV